MTQGILFHKGQPCPTSSGQTHLLCIYLLSIDMAKFTVIHVEVTSSY